VPPAVEFSNELMKDLPFLIKLLDDPSAGVRSKVSSRLRQLGPGVPEALREAGIVLTSEQRDLLDDALRADDALILCEAWEQLRAGDNDAEYLESGLLLLSRWQGTEDALTRGPRLMDRLAGEFASAGRGGAGDLAFFLFGEGRFTGAGQDHYYEPCNSNLLYALEAGHGLPITLTALFILIGSRCGIQVEGCNFPGHFLARDARTTTYFDPFNGGRILSHAEVDALFRAAPEEMKARATGRTILSRVLRNLALAYHQAGQSSRSRLMMRLLAEMGPDEG